MAELVLVFWLFAFVLAALARFAGAQSRLAALQSDGTRAHEVSRIMGLVLSSELRSAAPADVRAFAPDSIRVRAFRGGGPACAAGGDTLVVAYAGVRLAEPAKDSLLLVRGDGTEEAVDVVAVGPPDPTCGEPGTRIRVGRALQTPAGFALVFETGVYDVTGGALRYRRGAGGRQPLTESLLAGATLEQAGPRSFRLAASMVQESLPRLDHPRARLRIARLNPETP